MVGWGRVSAYCVLFATMCHCKAIWQYARWARSGWGTHISAACNRLQPVAAAAAGAACLLAVWCACTNRRRNCCSWFVAAAVPLAQPLPLAAASAASGVVMLDGL